MKKLIFSLLTLVAAFAPAPASAALTSWDVHNVPQMYLDVPLNPDTTTGIRLSALVRNGSTFTFPTTTGAVLRVRQGYNVEDIHYTSATVDPTTKTVTLVGVTRNLCPQESRQLISCGNGRSFSRGAIVEENTDARLFNLKANIDRANTFTASGAIAFSGSGTFRQPYFATEAERDAYIPSPQGAMASCVDMTGTCYDYMAGAWRSRSGSNVINASTSVAGKVQLATTGAILARTSTGATGAFNVVTANRVTTDYRGDTNDYDLVALSGSALIDLDLIPNVTVSKLCGGGGTSSTYLRGDCTWVNPASSLSPLVYAAGTGSNTISGTTNETDFNKQWTLTGGTVSTGTVLVVKGSGYARNPSGSSSPVIRVYIGSVLVGSGVALTTNGANAFSFENTITVQNSNAAGRVGASMTIHASNAAAFLHVVDRYATGIDFTTNKTMKVTGALQSAGSNSVFLRQLQIWKYTPGYTN